MEINYLNLQKAAFEGVGAYDIPLLSPETFTDCELIGFNQAKTCKERGNKAVHFFLYDYQFERIWNRPDAYVDMLKQFKCIFSPDFSVYCDYPRALQIYNHYRKHWIGAYMQINGISVIPTIGWSNEDSFEWCFDGEPKGSAVAVSSVGTQKNKQAKLRTSGKWDRNILKQAKKINGGKLSAISKYGSNTKGKAAGEVVAEAVSEYMKKGKSASSTSKAIVQALKSYV